MMGHFARKCHNKQSISATGNQSRPQAQQNYMYGKVNYVTSEEAQQAQDMILGMFLASSHPATILFGSEHRIHSYHHALWQSIICQ
jgi:hypothetical protein